jgi:hypothetical protein
VIDEIQKIIDWSIQKKSPIGYFAALYKRTTIAIRGAIAADRFESGPRMVEFDVTFARRYFDAVNAQRDGGTPTQVWQTAFKNRDGRKRLIILQQLMTAMNAHIDLDLGVVTATIGGKSLDSLHNDFVAVNTILASQVPGVLNAIDKVSPSFKKNRKWLNNKDADFVTGALSVFRDNAWKFASQLAAKPNTQRPNLITQRDGACAWLGNWYIHPLPFVPVIDAIGKDESAQVATNIQALNQVAARPAPLPQALW